MRKDKFISKEEHISSGYDKFEQKSIGSEVNEILKERLVLSPTVIAIGIWQFELKTIYVRVKGIYLDGLLNLITHLGYRKRYDDADNYYYILDMGSIIKRVDVPQIRDEVTNVVRKCEKITSAINGVRFIIDPLMLIEVFLRNSSSLFNEFFFGHLPNHSKPVLRDDNKTIYFPFKNCIIRIDSNGVFKEPYSFLKNHCIWENHILGFEIELCSDYESSHFSQFIRNICGNQSDRQRATRSAIGYLLHNYRKPENAEAVIAYDEQLAEKNEPEGGTGKGLFNQALSELRASTLIDGKRFDPDNKFTMQRVTEHTQIIFIDDVKEDFDFLTLNSSLSEGFEIEQKHKPTYKFPVNHSPKLYITSNTVIKNLGNTAKRRQFIIEFSPFYSNLQKTGLEPIIQTHGHRFFSDEWSSAEWTRFYNFMFKCCQEYQKNGLVKYKHKSVEHNRLIQNTSMDFYKWILSKSLVPYTQYSTAELYHEFNETYFGEKSSFTQRTFTKWLRHYSSFRGLEFEISRISVNGEKKSVFMFKKNGHEDT